MNKAIQPIRYNPSETGLTEQQVNQRIKEKLDNKVNNNYSKTYRQIFFDNLFTYFNLLYFIVTLALILFNNLDEIGYLFIVVPNILISIIQEINAKRTIEKLSLISSKSVAVIRQGVKQQINTSSVVLDDIILLNSGDQIVADSIVISGEVEVDESLLTGESVSVKKIVGDNLLAGSYIKAGSCISRADCVGKNNYIEKLKSKVQKHKKTNSEILISLNKLIKVIGIIIPFVALFTGIVANSLQKTSNISQLIATIAGPIIGMIPAGLFLLTTVALAVSVVKLARNKALVQDIYCIEMLSRVDVLCFDKTGTITDGNMEISTIKVLDDNSKVNVEQILLSIMEHSNENNSTAQAIKNYCLHKEIKQLQVQQSMPFSSKNKQIAAIINNITYQLGAPEYVLNPIDDNLSKVISSYTTKGYRVILLASSNNKIVNNEVEKADNAIALIIISEHIRPDAIKTIKYFNDNGVSLKVISGDNENTVSEIAKQAGIVGADKAISLYGKTNEQVYEAAKIYNIFSRVNPDQKHILIKSLRDSGYIVGMTGDGVNDILALKEADCSISMASGSAAARNASQLVLLDSDFSRLPLVVAEGRQVINNIQRTSSLFLMKTIFTTLFAIICIICVIQYPFTAKQFLLLEMFVIGAPSLALALQPNKDIVKGKFLNNIISNALPSGLTLVICISSLFIVNLFISVSAEELKAMASLTLTLCGIMMLIFICLPLNKFRLAVVIASIIAVILMYCIFWTSADLIVFKFGLDLAPLTTTQYITCFIITLLSIPLRMLMTIILKKDKKKKIIQ